MLRRLAGDDADDIAQDTFLIAWRGAASWRREGSYRAWLLRIAWRQFLSHRRRHKPTEAAEAPGVQACADEKVAIAQAMGRLGERERMAAHLCFAEGFTHEEAAMIIHVPLGTLKSLVARAKRELAAHLENGQ
jgi:RNA polymerase sigma-70 factor (ECF subfamily)